MTEYEETEAARAERLRREDEKARAAVRLTPGQARLLSEVQGRTR